MIIRGVGYSTDTDSFIAGEKAARRALAENPSPDIAIAFICGIFDTKKCFNGIQSVLKNIPVWGTGTVSVAVNSGIRDNAVSILLLSSEFIDFKIYSAQCDMSSPYKTTYELGKKYLSENNIQNDAKIACLITGTETHLKGFEYLEGLQQVFPFPVAVSGAGSMGKYDENIIAMFDGFQICGNKVCKDSVSLLFMNFKNTDKCTVGFSYESNWTALAPPVICTKTEKDIVYELDNRPVIEYFRNYLGADYQQTLMKTQYKYSFIATLKDDITDKYVIRTPLFDFENGRISFFPAEDMTNVEVQLVQLNRHELIQSAETAALNALCSIEGFKPAAVFMFSCHLRSRILHSKTDHELNSLRKFFMDDVPIVGFYGAGEYGPVYNTFDDVINSKKMLCGSRQYSTSISVMVLGSKELNNESGQYRRLLHSYESQDKENIDIITHYKNTIKSLTQKLNSAEKIISETELALQYINNSLYTANQKNEMLQSIIRTYTPHNVWKKAHISADKGIYEIPDEQLNCTLMFLDIKGFTSFAEKHSPQEVIAEINRIFSPVTTIIYQHNGDIDKYIGDCVFAVFGNADEALGAALKIKDHVSQIDTTFLIRMGINTGRVISGNVGNDERRDNTMIGDAVNLAQRLESSCTPGRILISKHDFSLIKNKFSGIKTEKKQISVKGKSEVIEVVEIY